MINLSRKYSETLDYINKLKPFEPEISIVLGSGLGNFAKRVTLIKEISTADIPLYPVSTIIGHAGKIIFAEYAGKKILLFQGRIHFYEGYKIYECLLPVFISHKLGCSKIILTNAAGGINTNFIPGDLMLNISINGINIKKELNGFIGIPSGEGLNNLHNFPSPELNKIIKTAALECKIALKEGIYWYNKGPYYETPAEIKMAARFDADAVGMSTVHEAIYASYLGMHTSAVSCITNYAAGISTTKLNHAEVTETAKLVENKFEELVKKTIELITPF